MTTFLKGDTTAEITLALAEGFDYSGKTVCLEYQGVKRSFSGATAGGTLAFFFNAGETAPMSLGTYPVRAWIEDDNGNVTTINNADVKMRVTDCIADVRSGSAIYLDVRGGLFGIDGLPERYTDEDVRNKINEILLRLGGTVAMLLLCALPVFGASLSLHTAPKGVIYNDQQVVTNATLDVSDLVTTGQLATAVGAIPAPDFTTNNTELIDTIEVTAPAPGDYAAVSNAAVYAAMTNALQDAAIAGKASTADATLTPVYGGNGEKYSAWSFSDGETHTVQGPFENENNGSWYYRMDNAWSQHGYFDTEAEALTATSIPFLIDDAPDIIATRTANPLLGYTLGSQTNDVVASTNGIVRTERLAEATSNITAIVSTWENFLDGSNVVFSITNYISGTYSLDAAKLRIMELREGEYHEVYNSRDEILLHIENFATNDFRTATNELVGAVSAAIEDKADRDWGKYTSAGGEAPSNTVYMTAPNTVFAGGMEYERVAVGEGTICVLTTHGAPVWTQGDEGTFKFQDDGGTNYFGFAKTDSYTVGANTDGITVQGDMVTLLYNITMSGRPCIWYKADLTAGTEWEQLNLPDGSPVAGASHAVTWEQNPDPDTQVCYINVGSQPSGFFKATVEVSGSAKFMTNMPADLSGGIFCTDGVHKVRPVYNNGSVTWEVFQ